MAGYLSVLRRAAQYFFIRSDTVFLAAADIPFRFFPPALAALSFAQRARCAAAMARRPAADRFPRVRLVTGGNHSAWLPAGNHAEVFNGAEVCGLKPRKSQEVFASSVISSVIALAKPENGREWTKADARIGKC